MPLYESPDRLVEVYLDSPIVDSDFFQDYVDNKYRTWGTFYIDMVKKTQLLSENTARVIFTNENSLPNGVNSNGYLGSLFKSHLSDEEIESLCDYFENQSIVFSYDGKKMSTDFHFSDEVFDTVIRILSKKQHFDINGALTLLEHPFDLEANYEILTMYLPKYFTYLGMLRSPDCKLDIESLFDYYSSEILAIHGEFIRPLIPRGFLFDVNLHRIIRIVKTHPKAEVFPELALLFAYRDYLTAVMVDFPPIFESEEVEIPNFAISEEAEAFLDLIKQYLTDYQVAITPQGIGIYPLNTVELGKIGGSIPIYDPSLKISLSMLSSGECKIILLCFLCIFTNRSILFLDEPELSISIVWQERLLRDLLDYGTFRSIIVATHSPYIARAKELEPYLCFLP